ncbi:MAG: tRNA lysidine(34) synthetase TilS [Chloroflexi bacterium]|nr:tRNA lysidine(34) synthetase TilS [Chloroflexota bacterium]
MSEKIESVLEKECGLVKERPIIVGVSGGPDSMCLMEILRQAGYSIVVAHFDHQLRPESGQDARMVEQAASRLMLGCIVDGADVRAHAAQEKLSVEEAARNLRYRFLFRVARERNAQAVAVGHTADDQVETILMHFLRGSGIAGLKGMSHRSILKTFDPEMPIVRPLLNMWRDETVVYCAANGLRPRYDSSNDSLNFQRNRIRHLLLPGLESYNPKFREAVLRMSHSVRADYAFLMDTLETAWREIATSTGDGIVIFDLERLSESSLALQRNLIKHAMQILRPGVDVNFSAVERATDLLKDTARASFVDLKGGLRMTREAGHVYISIADAKLPINLWPQMTDATSVPVNIPGQVILAGGWKLNSERWRIPALAKEQAEQNGDPFQVWLDAEKMPESIQLRIRRPGDVFAPLGMDGHSQKLSDFFVNEKMPQRARDHWPLLCAGDDILWVPGYRPAHPYRLAETTKRAVYFSVANPLDKS